MSITRKKIFVANMHLWIILSASGRRKKRKEKSEKCLLERGIDLELMKAEQGMVDVDDFDFICHVAFRQKTFDP